MERTIDQSHFQLVKRITSQHTVLHSLLETFLYGRDEFLRNVTTLHLIDELQSTLEALVCRLHTNDDICELTTTSRLLFVNLAKLNRLRDSLLISNLRTALVTFNLELTTQTVDDDIQVKLTHTANNGLTCLLVCLYAESRILLGQLSQAHTQLIHVFLSLRLYCDTDNRFREFHRLQCDRMVFVAKRITCTDILETNTCSDITTTNHLHRVLLVRVHLEQTGDTLFLSGTSVQHIRTSVDRTCVYTEEAQTTYIRVGSDLKCQRRQRLLEQRFTSDYFIRI